MFDKYISSVAPLYMCSYLAFIYDTVRGPKCGLGDHKGPSGGFKRSSVTQSIYREKEKSCRAILKKMDKKTVFRTLIFFKCSEKRYLKT